MGTLANINNTENWQRRGWATFIALATSLFVGAGIAWYAWGDDLGRWLR